MHQISRYRRKHLQGGNGKALYIDLFTIFTEHNPIDDMMEGGFQFWSIRT